MDGWEFWQTARRLRSFHHEGDRRTAISRAYYAVYNGMCQLLARQGLRLSKGPAGHGELRNLLQGSGYEQLEDIGDHLGTLHGARVRADYKMECDPKHVSPSALELALERSAQAKNAADGLDLDLAVRSIREYLRVTNQGP